MRWHETNKKQILIYHYMLGRLRDPIFKNEFDVR